MKKMKIMNTNLQKVRKMKIVHQKMLLLQLESLEVV